MKNLLVASLLFASASVVQADTVASITRFSQARTQDIENNAIVKSGGSHVTGSPDLNSPTVYTSTTHEGTKYFSYTPSDVDYYQNLADHDAYGNALSLTLLDDNNGNATTNTITVGAGGSMIAKAQSASGASPVVSSRGMAKSQASIDTTYEFADDADATTDPYLYGTVEFNCTVTTADAAPAGMEAINMVAVLGDDIDLTATYSPSLNEWTISGTVKGVTVDDTVSGMELEGELYGSLTVALSQLGRFEDIHVDAELDETVGFEGVDTETSSDTSTNDYVKDVKVEASVDIKFFVKHIDQ